MSISGRFDNFTRRDLMQITAASIGGVSLSGWLPRIAQATDGKRPPKWGLDRDPFLLETGMSGVFVAGDTRSGSVKRVASSVGEGSITVAMVHQYLTKVR